MAAPKESDQQRELSMHRRNLDHLELRAARYGGEEEVPLDLFNDLHDTRESITRLEAEIAAGQLTYTATAAKETPEQRNRRTMLENVKTTWIKGLLEQSLTRETRIALDVVEQSDALLLPLNTQVQELQRAPQPIAAGTLIIDLFAQMRKALLILGAPGAGKTILLVELLRDMITEAEQDAALPIPVLFNLSSWGTKHPPLAAWLVDELNAKYDVPRKVGQAWVDTDQIALLLDGLDEVTEEQRDACAEAINVYREQHGFVPIAVCSRLADYQALSTRLKLHGAVVINPLTPAQIDTYLDHGGAQLAGLKQAIAIDTTLQELAASPLMLTIMTLAYRGTAPDALLEATSADEQRKQIFRTYVDRVFTRRSTAEYPQQQTVDWLTWLAQELQTHGQTIFLLERLQPDWLPNRAAAWQYSLIDRVGGALSAVLFVGLITGFSYWLGYGLESGILNGLGFGIVAGLSVGLLGKTADARVLSGRGIWPVAWRFGLGALTFGLIAGIFFWLISGQENALIFGLFAAVVGGLGAGLIGGPSIQPRFVAAVETFKWSIARGLAVGLPVAVAVGVISWLLYDLIGISNSASSGLVYGLVYGLTAGAVFGLVVNEVPEKTIPNQGIWRSAKSATQAGLRVGIACGLGGVIGGLVVNQGLHGVVYALSAASLASLASAIVCGGFACLHHSALRLILYRTGRIPKEYIDFLDSCVERILLRRVGGGWIFIHRYLLEYFAHL